MPSDPPRKHKYRLQFVPSSWKEWQALDGSVKETLRKLLKKRLDNPHVSGAELHGALAGHYKVKLRKQGYRLVFGVHDVLLMVMDKREYQAMHQSATARITELVGKISKGTP